MAIYPNSEQIQALLSSTEEGPIVMINLLRFKERADAPHADLTGEAAYQLYANEMLPFVESKGGRVIWMGRTVSQVIGTGGEDFDVVALVEYPSRQAFVEVAMDPHVAEIGAHRAAGLEMQWLIASTTQG